jgi:hypothetical protein
LTFFVEIFQDGISKADLFTDPIISGGGKISKRFTNKVTHLIWSEGRLKSLIKASDAEIPIVTPFWIDICIK